MIDTLTTFILKTLRPSHGAEYYVFTIVVGALLAWFGYLYYKLKGGLTGDSREGSESINQDGSGLQQADRDRLIRLEESIKAIQSDFIREIKDLKEICRSLIHDRGDQMQEIGELKGEFKAILREIKS